MRAVGRAISTPGFAGSVGEGGDDGWVAKTVKLDKDALLRQLASQHGVISRAQAAACGMTPAALRHRVRPGGPWQILLPGVYLANTGSAGRAQLDMAALLHAGSGSVLSGLAALSRHGARVPRTGVVDVLVPAARIRRDAGFVRLHRTARMPERVCYSGQVNYALAPRAVADAARWLTEARTVRGIVADAVQRGLCPLDRLTEELAAGPMRGSALLRQALAEVAEGARSVAEGDFLLLIKRARLPEPMLNPRLFAGETFIASPDCWWPQAGLAAEVDSREWHLSPGDWEQTLARHRRMTGYGITVLHFTPGQIARDPKGVIRDLAAALAVGQGRQPLPVTARPATA
jgi:hypothetical protein